MHYRHVFGLIIAVAGPLASASTASGDAIVHYGLNESSGTVADDIGGVHMTPRTLTAADYGLLYGQSSVPAGTYGAVTITPAQAAAFGTSVVGMGLSPDSSFHNTTSNNALNTLATKWTISAWIKPDAIGSVQRILSSGPLTLPDGRRTGWGYGLNSSAAGATSTGQRFTTYGVRDFNQTTGAFIVAGEWQHVAMTYLENGTNATVLTYLNGNLTSTLAGGATQGINPNATFGLFGTNSGSEPFGGAIDDVWVYNRVLTQNEIRLAATGVEVVVPEPGAVAMVATVGLLALRRRRRQMA